MKYIYVLVFFVSICGFAQQRNDYKVRLMGSETTAFPLKVINTTTSETATTDVAGYFVMQLQESDELVLQENDYYQLKYLIKATDLENKIVRIYPEPLTTVLKEVEVETISSKSLGVDRKTIADNTVYNVNPNMDFKALFLWVVNKLHKPKPVDTRRAPHEMNPYVANLPRSIITDYLKIPDSLVEKFYYFMNDDYEVDEYIKQGDEAKWKMHLLDKSFQFLEQQNISVER